MLKRILSIFAVATVMSSGLLAMADSDVATMTFDTNSAVANMYTEGDPDAILTITDEFAFTGKSLKVELNVPDAKTHEAKIIFDAGKLKLPNFNNCTIEAHILFPEDCSKIWGPGSQSVSLIATDPTWLEARSDRTLYGAWQTVTLKCVNENNRSFGFYIPINDGNEGKLTFYIDDIRILKDNDVIASIDMDSSLSYPLPTDTATFKTTAATTVSNDKNDDEAKTTTKKVTTPVEIDEENNSALIIILVVSLVIIGIIAGVIYFFVWKSKNKYY